MSWNAGWVLHVAAHQTSNADSAFCDWAKTQHAVTGLHLYFAKFAKLCAVNFRLLVGGLQELKLKFTQQ
jgi:hypothetical protein